MSGRAVSYFAIGAGIFAVIAILVSRAIVPVILGFGLGVLVCSYFPELSGWVRDAGSWLRTRVNTGLTGRKPAARAQAMYAVPPPDLQGARGPDLAAVAGGVARGALNIVDFFARYWRPLALILAALLIWGLVKGIVGFFPGLFESRTHAIARADHAEAHIETQRQVTHAGAIEGQRFRHTATVIGRALDEGREEIQDSLHEDSRALFLAFARADQRLCASAGGCGADRS